VQEAAVQEAAVQKAANAISNIASAPNDLPAQLPPGVTVVSVPTNQLKFLSVLQCLEEFVKIPNLTAEVCLHKRYSWMWA